jgi:hypothetical protein
MSALTLTHDDGRTCEVTIEDVSHRRCGRIVTWVIQVRWGMSGCWDIEAATGKVRGSTTWRADAGACQAALPAERGAA